ncbi:MAG TPA: DUF5666 domain-containing protein [Thiolinea sp.]|nr:DUF5666 domain-containing protein [Thiolinea sp.]
MKINAVLLGQLLLAASLTACVETGTNLAEGGMSGTGISVGAITGFGSIYVNGIHFNVDQASFTRDGAGVSSQDSFNLGELVTVSGSISADGSSGIATSVEFESLINGEVTAVSSDDRSVDIMGQRISTDSLTVLHGIARLSDLALGNIAEVSGTRDAQGVIQASSIQWLGSRFDAATSSLEVQGSISELSTVTQSFRLDQLLIDYTQASLPGTPLANGLRVKVRSSQALQNGRVTAQQITLSKQHHFPENSQVELEGLVTVLESRQHFQLDRQWVVTDDNTRFKDLEPDSIRLNGSLEITGAINASGELVASLVEPGRTRNADAYQRVNGSIEAIDLDNSTLQVNGLTLLVDNSSMLLSDGTDGRHHQSLTLAQLTVGESVQIKAASDGNGNLRVLRLEPYNGQGQAH